MRGYPFPPETLLYIFHYFFFCFSLSVDESDSEPDESDSEPDFPLHGNFDEFESDLQFVDSAKLSEDITTMTMGDQLKSMSNRLILSDRMRAPTATSMASYSRTSYSPMYGGGFFGSEDARQRPKSVFGARYTNF